MAGGKQGTQGTQGSHWPACPKHNLAYLPLRHCECFVLNPIISGSGRPKGRQGKKAVAAGQAASKARKARKEVAGRLPKRHFVQLQVWHCECVVFNTIILGSRRPRHAVEDTMCCLLKHQCQNIPSGTIILVVFRMIWIGLC